MSGHGHVTPNADGSLARCGGPGLCHECSVELTEKRRRDDFAGFATDHTRHVHCIACGGCLLDPRQVVQVSVPVWCVGCRERIDQAMAPDLVRPWDAGWVMRDGELVTGKAFGG